MILEECKEDKKVSRSIDAKNIRIFDYLKNSRKIIIPRYQREYSWGKDNILMLISDFKDDYYIGNVIEYNNIEFMEKEIIDGQQRIITIFLILIAICHLTANQKTRKEILEIIKNEENKCKLNLKPRIGIDGSEVLEYILEDVDISREIKEKYNEIPMYKIIEKELQSKNVDELYMRIKNSNIVEISFSTNETSAHEMFVNVNTKGKPLEMIEILKSQLFRYLLSIGNTDPYKEEWQNMLEKIPRSEYDNFCNDIYLLDYFNENKENENYNYNTSGTSKVNSMKLLNSINSLERAKYIFEFMTGNSINNVFQVYSAIKNHSLLNLKEEYYSPSISRVSLGEINSIWNLFGEFGFKQGDILFITLLFNKEQFLSKDIDYLNIIMRYVFMYELYRSVMKISPANYSNSFKQAAARIYNTDNTDKLKETIKYFINTITIEEREFKKFRDNLLNGNEFISSKAKTAKYIIMMAEEFYTPNLTSEHFIPQKTEIEDDKSIVGKLGNIIPVTNDKYKNKSVKDKLELYELDKSSNKGIENFIRFGFDENNYKYKISERNEVISDKFIKKMKEYYERIMKG